MGHHRVPEVKTIRAASPHESNRGNPTVCRISSAQPYVHATPGTTTGTAVNTAARVNAHPRPRRSNAAAGIASTHATAAAAAA